MKRSPLSENTFSCIKSNKNTREKKGIFLILLLPSYTKNQFWTIITCFIYKLSSLALTAFPLRPPEYLRKSITGHHTPTRSSLSPTSFLATHGYIVSPLMLLLLPWFSLALEVVWLIKDQREYLKKNVKFFLPHQWAELAQHKMYQIQKPLISLTIDIITSIVVPVFGVANSTISYSLKKPIILFFHNSHHSLGNYTNFLGNLVIKT